MPRTNPTVWPLIGSLVAMVLAVPALEAQTSSSSATAHTKEAFTYERFEELQAQGALVLVDIFADWCPDCAIQQTVLDAYRERRPDVALHTLVVDFDTEKDVVIYFRAPRQSTLILYRGTERLWFSVAETREEVIAQALNEGTSTR